MNRNLADELVRLKGDLPLLYQSAVIDAAVNRVNEFPLIRADYVQHGLTDPARILAYAQAQWAQKLIARFTVFYATKKEPKVVRGLISLSTDRVNGGGYRTTRDVHSTPELLTVLCEDHINELERLIRKADGLLKDTKSRKRYLEAGERLLACFAAGKFDSPPTEGGGPGRRSVDRLRPSA